MQRINLITDPLFTKLPASNDLKITTTINRRGVRAESTISYQSGVIVATVTGLQPATGYVLHGMAYTERKSAPVTNGDICVYGPAGKNYLGAYTVSKSNTTESFLIRFTAPSDGAVEIVLHVVPSSVAACSSLNLESAATYDTAVGGGLPSFFTGDTMPLR